MNFWLRLLLCAVVGLGACTEGRHMAWPPSGKLTKWEQGSVPGMTFYERATGPHQSQGIARVDGKSGYLTGMKAFDEARKRLGDHDLVLLARLAMLLVNEGVAGDDPWTGPGRFTEEEDRVAKPPSISGDVFEYWRRHEQLPNLMRARLNLATGAIDLESADKIARGQAMASDPWPVIERDLGSDSYDVALRGIRELEALGTPKARERLQKEALGNKDYSVREGAVLAVSRLGGDGALDTLLHAVTSDASGDVRKAAVKALVELGDPKALDTLRKVANSDSEPTVQAEAQIAVNNWSKKP